MKLRHRLPLLFSLLFSVVLAIVLFTVFYLFARFRKEEFRDRLGQRAETTLRLLLEVKEVDINLLRIIDSSSINKLHNEKLFIFNDSLRLIYSSAGDTVIEWSPSEQKLIKEQGSLFKRNRKYDVMAIYYPYNNRDYYALISAEDRYGIRKLNYLKFLLLGAFVAGTVLVWFLSFYASRTTLKPLEKVRRKMLDISTNSLNVRLEESGNPGEIQALSRSFNQMMDRIDSAYENQKEFTSNASHELRTPVARIVMQLENLLKGDHLDAATRKTVQSISEDSYQLSDIITSLLLLSRIDATEGAYGFQKVRLDEVIFHIAGQMQANLKDFKLHFEIENETTHEISMEVEGDETLLRIAILNLFRNAYAYSDNHLVGCIIRQQDQQLLLIIRNSGEPPLVPDTSSLFQTFTRGSNAKNRAGNGIGLSIVQRILTYHKATIVYRIPDGNSNEVTVTFPYAS
jgi:signal transduction histidine kinase